jgi:signal peptide peptidase SppA
MNYELIASYIANTPWAIDESKMWEMLAVLSFRQQGGRFSAEEIQARIGSPRPSTPSSGALAVIPLRGVIAHRMSTMQASSGGMSAESFRADVLQATADPSIGTILIDCDSPGGSIPGVPEAADAVFAARATKRVVAVANDTCASAAYWIASQAHEIVAIPSAMDMSIGSIGVFAVHLDMSEKLVKDGAKVTIIRAGVNKNDMSSLEPLSPEAHARLTAGAAAAKGQFLAAVARGRGLTPTQVETQYGDGLVFSAPDALKAGLIDAIGTMDETIARLMGPKQGASGMRALTTWEARSLV